MRSSRGNAPIKLAQIKPQCLWPWGRCARPENRGPAIGTDVLYRGSRRWTNNKPSCPGNERGGGGGVGGGGAVKVMAKVLRFAAGGRGSGEGFRLGFRICYREGSVVGSTHFPSCVFCLRVCWARNRVCWGGGIVHCLAYGCEVCVEWIS